VATKDDIYAFARRRVAAIWASDDDAQNQNPEKAEYYAVLDGFAPFLEPHRHPPTPDGDQDDTPDPD